MSMPYAVSKKLVISGNFLEIYDYQKPYWVGYPQIRSFRENTKVVDQVALRDDNVRRTRQKIRRLINCNRNLDRFFTITFAENKTDLRSANVLFNQFVKRLRRLYPDFQYLGVPEFQKRGAVHYHLLCNLPFIDENELTKIWGNGFCWLRRVDSVDNLGAYISKYLGKANFDKRYFKMRKFFYSMNLLKSVVVDNLKDIVKFMRTIPKCFYEKVYNTEVFTKYLGMVQYEQIRVSSLIKVGSHL